MRSSTCRVLAIGLSAAVVVTGACSSSPTQTIPGTSSSSSGVGGSGGGAGGSGGAPPTSFVYHVEIHGHGSLTFGAIVFSCGEDLCKKEITVAAAHAGAVVLAPNDDWVIQGLKVDGEDIGPPELPAVGDGFFANDRDATLVATFIAMPPCPLLADLPAPPTVDLVYQGDSQVGILLFADACVGGHVEITGANLAADVGGGALAACVTVGNVLAAGYAGAAGSLSVDVPTAVPEGPALLVVRTRAGRIATMVNAVALPAPMPTAIAPTSGAVGSPFTITGTAMDRVISVIFSPEPPTFYDPAVTSTTSATSAVFDVTTDQPAIYNLGSVYNACAGSAPTGFTFTIQ